MEKRDKVGDAVYFIESQNNGVSNQYYGNCVVSVKLDGLWRLAVTYCIQFQENMAHLWVLKRGNGLDCNCSPPTTKCLNRLCGFKERFKAMSISLGDNSNNLIPLNQLYSAPWIQFQPRDHVLSMTDYTYQCSLYNCNFFFPHGVEVSKIDISRLKRGHGFKFSSIPEDIPSTDTAKRRKMDSSGAAINHIKQSFNTPDQMNKYPTVFAVFGMKEDLSSYVNQFAMPPVPDAGVTWFWNIDKDDLISLRRRLRSGITLKEYQIMATKAKEDGKSFMPQIISLSNAVHGL